MPARRPWRIRANRLLLDQNCWWCFRRMRTSESKRSPDRATTRRRGVDSKNAGRVNQSDRPIRVGLAGGNRTRFGQRRTAESSFAPSLATPAKASCCLPLPEGRTQCASLLRAPPPLPPVCLFGQAEKKHDSRSERSLANPHRATRIARFSCNPTFARPTQQQQQTVEIDIEAANSPHLLCDVLG